MLSEGPFSSFGWYAICKPMDHKDLTTMTHALITNQLDYHNALYLGLSLQTVWKLVQNVAVHLLADIDHQVPTDISKHWHWLIWFGATCRMPSPTRICWIVCSAQEKHFIGCSPWVLFSCFNCLSYGRESPWKLSMVLLLQVPEVTSDGWHSVISICCHIWHFYYVLFYHDYTNKQDYYFIFVLIVTGYWLLWMC